MAQQTDHMTPKEKAKELVESMSFSTFSVNGVEMGEYIIVPRNSFAKECALIAVNEIIKAYPRHPSNVDWDDVGGTHKYYYGVQRGEPLKYWHEVKQEIEKL